jgi:glycine/D-amino acid oxidase-like deaminating enzyme
MSKPEMVVVGAGIIGASIAWHLAAAGARVAVVVAGGVATPDSFAWINATHGNPEPYFGLRVRSMAEWRRVTQAVPDLPISWCGGLRWGLPPDKLEAYVSAHRQCGYDVQLIGSTEAARIEPSLIGPPSTAVYAPREGAVRPNA